MNFYELLKYYIAKKRLKHSYIAYRLGVSNNYITNIVSNRGPSPTFERIEKLAEVFELKKNSKERVAFFKACWLQKQKADDWKFMSEIGIDSIINSEPDEINFGEIKPPFVLDDETLKIVKMLNRLSKSQKREVIKIVETSLKLMDKGV